MNRIQSPLRPGHSPGSSDARSTSQATVPGGGGRRGRGGEAERGEEEGGERGEEAGEGEGR